jgi:hypothetical protein
LHNITELVLFQDNDYPPLHLLTIAIAAQYWVRRTLASLRFRQNPIGHVPDFVRTLGNAGIMRDDDDTIPLFMRQSSQDFDQPITVGFVQIAGGFVG